MAPIPDTLLDRHKYIFMYDDERVLDAIVALRDANGYDWWYLLVDVEESGYAAAPFSALAAGIEESGEAFLNRRLGELVGEELAPVECIAQQSEADYERVSWLTARSSCPVAVIMQGDELRGILPVAGTRGAFDVGVINLAGKYAPLPEQGLLSPRRQRPKKKPRPAQGRDNDPRSRTN